MLLNWSFQTFKKVGTKFQKYGPHWGFVYLRTKLKKIKVPKSEDCPPKMGTFGHLTFETPVKDTASKEKAFVKSD